MPFTNSQAFIVRVESIRAEGRGKFATHHKYSRHGEDDPIHMGDIIYCIMGE